MPPSCLLAAAGNLWRSGAVDAAAESLSSSPCDVLCVSPLHLIKISTTGGRAYPEYKMTSP